MLTLLSSQEPFSDGADGPVTTVLQSLLASTTQTGDTVCVKGFMERRGCVGVAYGGRWPTASE